MLSDIEQHATNRTMCRASGCSVEIMMVRYAKPPHKRAPIEVEPSDDGNVLVTGDTYEILNPEERERAKQRGLTLHKNHFATCKFSRAARRHSGGTQ